jgi:pimeloyl-ACP methyl ester carboxylesterase
METMRIFNVSGVQLEVAIVGPANPSAPSLVFLHEGLGSVSLWRDWPAQLCAQLHMPGLIYSRQGYGQSDATANVKSNSKVINCVRQGRLQADYMHHEALTVLPRLLEGLGIQNPVLIGHSDGGTIALIHASQHPVAACVVMAPHVMVEDISVHAIAQAREAFLQGSLKERLAKFHADVDGAFWQWNDVWLSSEFRGFDIRKEIESMTAPLLAIQGEDDAYGTMAQIDDIAVHVPHAERVKLASCGHSPHRDQPAQVNAAIAQFLSKHLS